ncbi:MAG TPA: DoxX family protein [Longimicrobiaceae bacterium]|nr:DoxX family protein [Longimicrobiaceae bacterium]
MHHLLTGGSGGASRTADAGLLVLRVFAGLALALAHGLGKLPPSPRFLATVQEMGFPAPHLFAWAAGVSELFGGLLVAVGLLTRPAATLALLTLLTAAVLRHAGDPFDEREKALLFAAVMLLFALAGPGRYSLDALLARRRFPPGVSGAGTPRR